MKHILPLSLIVVALPAMAQDIATLTAETKKAVLPVVPKVVNAMQEAVAAKPTADFDAKVPGAAASADRFVAQLYQDLKAAR